MELLLTTTESDFSLVEDSVEERMDSCFAFSSTTDFDLFMSFDWIEIGPDSAVATNSSLMGPSKGFPIILSIIFSKWDEYHKGVEITKPYTLLYINSAQPVDPITFPKF